MINPQDPISCLELIFFSIVSFIVSNSSTIYFELKISNHFTQSPSFRYKNYMKTCTNDALHIVEKLMIFYIIFMIKAV